MKSRPAILHIFLILLFLCTGIQSSFSQRYGINDTIIHEAVVYNGDTIESRTLSNVQIMCLLNEEQLSARAKYNRLRNAVYVTYPYARRAGMVMNDMNNSLVKMKSKSVKKSYIHSREKELRKEFTEPLMKLSVYQGKILMKLINRETGNNCYDIIKDYRGGLTARVYQTVAFFFNSSLRQPYNPAVNDDAIIEKLVIEVQRMYGFPEIRRNAML